MNHKVTKTQRKMRIVFWFLRALWLDLLGSTSNALNDYEKTGGKK